MGGNANEIFFVPAGHVISTTGIGVSAVTVVTASGHQVFHADLFHLGQNSKLLDVSTTFAELGRWP